MPVWQAGEVLAGRDGTVRASFAGEPTADELREAIARVRAAG